MIRNADDSLDATIATHQGVLDVRVEETKVNQVFY
jgi:hypothetical protein